MRISLRDDVPRRWPSCEDYSAPSPMSSKQPVAGSNPVGRAGLASDLGKHLGLRCYSLAAEAKQPVKPDRQARSGNGVLTQETRSSRLSCWPATALTQQITRARAERSKISWTTSASCRTMPDPFGTDESGFIWHSFALCRPDFGQASAHVNGCRLIASRAQQRSSREGSAAVMGVRAGLHLDSSVAAGGADQLPDGPSGCSSMPQQPSYGAQGLVPNAAYAWAKTWFCSATEAWPKSFGLPPAAAQVDAENW